MNSTRSTIEWSKPEWNYSCMLPPFVSFALSWYSHAWLVTALCALFALLNWPSNLKLVLANCCPMSIFPVWSLRLGLRREMNIDNLYWFLHTDFTNTDTQTQTLKTFWNIRWNISKLITHQALNCIEDWMHNQYC